MLVRQLDVNDAVEYYIKHTKGKADSLCAGRLIDLKNVTPFEHFHQAMQATRTLEGDGISGFEPVSHQSILLKLLKNDSIANNVQYLVNRNLL